MNFCPQAIKGAPYFLTGGLCDNGYFVERLGARAFDVRLHKAGLHGRGLFREVFVLRKQRAQVAPRARGVGVFRIGAENRVDFDGLFQTLYVRGALGGQRMRAVA